MAKVSIEWKLKKQILDQPGQLWIRKVKKMNPDGLLIKI